MTSIPRPGRQRLDSFSAHAGLPCLLLAGSILAASSVQAQTPTLVKDIFPGVSSTASAGAGFYSILGVSGGKALLNGMEDWNRGLWVSDGTAGGTRTILDLAAEAGVDVDGTFFFGASAQDGGSLWKTDGTAAGTAFVSRFSMNPSVVAQLSKPTKVGSRLFFVVDDGAHGAELWTSDGTTAGTNLVKDLTPGTVGSFDHTSELVDAGGTLFFTCRWDLDCGLWKSDGSEAGTVQLADLESVASLVNVNGTLFFRATDPVNGSELWKSDGTPAGTVLVRDVVPGIAGSSPNALVSFGGALYFRLGSDGSTWKSDGTEAGTILVHTFPTSDPLVPSGSFLYSASGTQLWASDGTSAGTALVRDFGTAFFLRNSTTLAGTLHLWVDRDADGLELWKSDGTPAGTTLVKVVEPGNASPFPLGSVSIPGASLHLLANMPFGLWRSDGTPAGTVPVQAPVFTPNDGLPVWLTDVNGTLLFSAVDAEHGLELWRSDGTPGGTSLVKDIEPGAGNSFAGPFFVAPSTVFFTAWTSATGNEIYRTDGTDAGTVLVKDIQPGESSYATPLGLLGELLLFAPDDGVHGAEPWRTDGTADGTYLLGDLTPGPASSQVSPIGVLNGEFLLAVSDGASTTLWKTDGTAAGTVAVGPMPAWVWSGVELGGALVFSASDPAHGAELWRTDGTAAGTTLILDVNPAGDSSPYPVARLGDRVVFWADDGTHGIEPWVTDGTASGTSLLKDINPGPARSSGPRWTVLGSTLFFWAHDGVHGYEPWKTDGTSAGTVLVRDVAAGPPGSMRIEHFAAAGHEVFFTASDRISGRELWRSDGTAAGTTRVADLAPGIRGGATPWEASVSKTVLARSGGRVFFTANDGSTGHELWSLPIPLGFHPVSPCRVADTRDPGGQAGGVPLADAETLILPVAGRCGIPSTAISVAANVTVVNPTATGFLSVFAGGPIVSGTTEVPVTAGKTRALNAVPLLGSTGSLSVRAGLPEGGTTHVLLDVSGYFE
jgi:trimeric autotransporter adhesin